MLRKNKIRIFSILLIPAQNTNDLLWLALSKTHCTFMNFLFLSLLWFSLPTLHFSIAFQLLYTASGKGIIQDRKGKTKHSNESLSIVSCSFFFLLSWLLSAKFKSEYDNPAFELRGNKLNLGLISITLFRKDVNSSLFIEPLR